MPEIAPVVDAQREELLKELDRLEADIAARTRHLPPLSDEEAEEIADELVREAVESLVEQGIIVFERDR
jgi:hypothetical protein